MEVKRCPVCKKQLPLTDFPKDRTHSCGLQSRCKQCKSQKNKEHYKKNREKILGQVKKYNKENKELISLRRKIHYQQNRRRMFEMGVLGGLYIPIRRKLIE